MDFRWISRGFQERYTFLDSVRDRNKISAVPNLLAQRLGLVAPLMSLKFPSGWLMNFLALLWFDEFVMVSLVGFIPPTNGERFG